MTKYRLSARAASQLDDIFDYGFANLGPNQARRYLEGFRHCFSLLADNPRMGRLSDTIRAGLRRHEHGSHVVIYKEFPDHILIVAVVHGRSIEELKL